MVNAVSRVIRILAVVSALSFLPRPVLADSPAPPEDYKLETENNEYVFVMLAPPEWAKFQDAEIRKVYPKSGLYRNDGSTTPLWVVHWYSFEVYPSSDGRHLVRMGPWASSTGQLALSFHRDGKEIKSYLIRDLVRDETKLDYTVSHFFWRSDLRYDDQKGLLFLKTKDDQTYLFVVKTGEIQPSNEAAARNAK